MTVVLGFVKSLWVPTFPFETTVTGLVAFAVAFWAKRGLNRYMSNGFSRD